MTELTSITPSCDWQKPPTSNMDQYNTPTSRSDERR